MLEFVRSILGTDSSYEILTTSYPTASSVPLQNYTILRVSEDIYAPKWVTCHPLPYPYAVFFCHYIGTGSKIFKVLLGGENGNQMEALGLCHLDTSEWTPEHVIFQQLGTKPGASPICHFLPVKHLVWVPLPSKAAM
ncbi:hypothetical protein L6164_035581 [Bauhinia variegata]|nr:hypothetical protein L6164_035581 [Bauhinia variegata]